jgi:hypothetical protein
VPLDGCCIDDDANELLCKEVCVGTDLSTSVRRKKQNPKHFSRQIFTDRLAIKSSLVTHYYYLNQHLVR